MKIHQPCALAAPSLRRLLARFSGWFGFLCVSFTAHGATVIQVDFNDNGDPGIINGPRAPQPGDPGGNWNVVALGSGPTFSDLTDFQTGGSSGVSMTLTNFTGADSPAAYQWSSTAWVDLEAGVDGVQTIRTDSPVTNATVVFDGLNPGSLYRIEVVAAVPFSAGIDFFDGSSYEVNGSAATRNSDNSFPFDSTDWNLQLATFFPAWMIWDDVAPSSGEITLTVLPNGTHPVFGDVGVINAIRLEETAIPEPTAAILLFLGVFAASFRRNRARS